jgi:hypothetical protein
VPKSFDAELNVLTEGHADEWGAFLCPRVGVPLGPLTPLDTDLATTSQADRLWRVDGPVPAILHVEFESSSHLGLPVRLLKYNVQVYDGLPVHSVVVLLRPEANASDLTGELVLTGADGVPYQTFKYRVVRLWHESMATLLAAGPAVAPLAVLTNEAVADPAAAFDRVHAHLLAAGLPVILVRDLVVSAFLFAGLRYKDDVTRPIRERMSMSFNLEESSTYQMIRRECEARGMAIGEARGALKKTVELLLRFGTNQFGPPSAAAEAELRAVTDVGRLDRMAERLPAAADWTDLLTTP